MFCHLNCTHVVRHRRGGAWERGRGLKGGKRKKRARFEWMSVFWVPGCAADGCKIKMKFKKVGEETDMVNSKERLNKKTLMLPVIKYNYYYKYRLT